MPEPTLGEQRILVHFNPSGDAMVDEIKSQAADLLNLIGGIPTGNSQCGRWKSMAMTEIETGAMYAVKAATAGQKGE